MKIAVSGERSGRALPSTLNISINYFRPVSDKRGTILGTRLTLGGILGYILDDLLPRHNILHVDIGPPG